MKSFFKRFLLQIAIIGAFLVAVPLQASAVNVFQPCDHGAKTSAVCQDVDSQKSYGSKNPIIGFIKIIIHLVAFVVGVASVIIIVVSGIRMVTSSGEAQAAASARNGIVYAAVGIIIVLLSEALVAFVLNKLQ